MRKEVSFLAESSGICTEGLSALGAIQPWGRANATAMRRIGMGDIGECEIISFTGLIFECRDCEDEENTGYSGKRYDYGGK